MTLEEITDKCIYLLVPHYEGHYFYNVQVEKAMWYETTCLYNPKTQKISSYNKDYLVQKKQGILRIYQKT